MEGLIIDSDEVIKRLNVLNVNKYPGPDWSHPRTLYEVRNEIGSALKIICNNSIQNYEVPFDWRASNISPIFKKEASVTLQIIGLLV